MFLSHIKIQTYRFRMANVQVTVWLWRETGGNRASVLPASDILNNDLADEVFRYVDPCLSVVHRIQA
jgi:hypothetical protein